MSTVGEFGVPVEEFVLSRTVIECPSAEFDVERAVPRGENRVLAVLWARASDRTTLRNALEADPTVARSNGLVDLETEWLYQMEWVGDLHLLAPALYEHNATLMRAHGSRDGWHLHLLAPERGTFGVLNEWCANAGLAIDLERLYDLDERIGSRFGLSANQYEALSIAHERGYFESPRATSASELAAELDISQQAFSERLQRASRNLLDTTIASNGPSTAFSYPSEFRTEHTR